MRIGIIGAGTVGKATGIGFALKGHKVYFNDIDAKKRKEIEALGIENASFIDTIDELLRVTDISFICVPTPISDEGEYDLQHIEDVARKIGNALQDLEKYYVIVLRSTVAPGTTRNFLKVILENESKKIAGKDFGLAYNPEFLREKSALEDFLNPFRIVIGKFDQKSAEVLVNLYLPFHAPIYLVSLEVAEMAKLVANAFLATKISFFNEVYLWCKNLNIDADLVSEIVAKDPRIGFYGTKGGYPFGGKCLPKDLEALIGFLKKNNIEAIMPKATKEINELMKKIAQGSSI